MTASGCAGHGTELGPTSTRRVSGAVVVKSRPPFPGRGTRRPACTRRPPGCSTPWGSRVPGVAAWLQDDLPPLLRTGARVVASIWGRSVEEYRAAAELLALAPSDVVAVEVNLSCPNLEDRRHMFAALAAGHAGGAGRPPLGCRRPRWAKLSPTTTELPEVGSRGP